MLLLIGVLAMFALWLIGLIAQARGYRVSFGHVPVQVRHCRLFRWRVGGWMSLHIALQASENEKEITALESLKNMAWKIQI